MAELEIVRGDVVYVDLRGAEGVEKQGSRPCLVVQNDVGNRFSPFTIVAPITDQRQNKQLPTQVAVRAEELGPEGKDSVIECGQLRTIDRDARIERVVSRLGEETMRQVNEALAVSVGLKAV